MSKINTVETKPKQSQFSRICWKHVHIQPILFKWVGGPVLFLKTYHIENLNSKNVQSLITMGEDRSFGNIFWLYNFRVFDIIKFVTFHKSWDRIWELYAKAKSYLISQEGQFFNKNLKKHTSLWSPCRVGVYLSLSYRATTRRQFSLFHKVPGVSDIDLIDQGRIKVWVSLESPSIFEPSTPRLETQHPNP